MLYIGDINYQTLAIGCLVYLVVQSQVEYDSEACLYTNYKVIQAVQFENSAVDRNIVHETVEETVERYFVDQKFVSDEFQELVEVIEEQVFDEEVECFLCEQVVDDQVVYQGF